MWSSDTQSASAPSIERRPHHGNTFSEGATYFMMRRTEMNISK